MRKITLIFLVLAMHFGTVSLAQSIDTVTNVNQDTVKLWKKSFNAGINLNQASFSDNWKAGGVNSIGVNTHLNYRALYEKNRMSWDNAFEFLYGFVNLSDQSPSFRKTNDRIFLDSKVGYDLNDNWELFGAMNFQTQFANGFQYERVGGLDTDEERLISGFLSPAFITTSWGFQYEVEKFFRLRLSPFSPRITIVRNENVSINVPENYGVPIGETVRYEWLAFQMMADFDKDIAENLNLKFRYLMFANYEVLDFNTIDHRLDITITAKVNRFLNVNLGAIVLYDIDQDAAVQFSQALSIGIAYTFKNFEDKK
ncbi:MAG: DUF3078 domain-containing protein [Cyclobacteriaceae bacterium]